GVKLFSSASTFAVTERCSGGCSCCNMNASISFNESPDDGVRGLRRDCGSTPHGAKQSVERTCSSMSQRNVPPFRADHVGSLLRPPELLRARQQYEAGEIGAEQLRTVEDDAIRESVRKQGEIGLQTATDGEFRRGSWHMDFIY